MFGQGVDADHLSHTMIPENRFQRGMPEHGAQLADQLLEMIALHDASNIAAVIVEPMAGSAGVIPPPVGYLQRLREICTEHDILLIFDEVITAFGRCGAVPAPMPSAWCRTSSTSPSRSPTAPSPWGR
jgi:beta-alanine--pyruvate transaminase